MTPRVVILLTGLCWTWQSTIAWQLCDNGKFQVELDLPHSSTLHCSEPFLEDLSQQVSIDQKYPPLQPVKHVCMDTPISYNATIPSRGDHRPVGAEPGVYLYCPPQRWLNNLQHGSIVVLHHPCAAEEQRSRLAALALSCLPAFIMSAHPWLSKHRPLALVSWGRTLEMSHVTAPEVCDWLVSVSIERWQHSHPRRRRGERYYNLMLTHAAPLQRPKGTTQDMHAAASRIDWLKNIRRCCEQSLSSHGQSGGTQRTEVESKWTQSRGETNRIQRREEGKRTHKRRRRAVLPARQGDQQDKSSAKLHPQLNNDTALHIALQPSQANDTSTPSTGVLVETHHPAAAVTVGSTAEPGTVTAHLSPPKEEHKQVGAGEPKKEEKVEEEAPRTEKQGGQSSGSIGAAAARAGGGGGGGGGGGEVQRKVTGAARAKSRSHPSRTHPHGQSHQQEKQGERGASSARQRVREDTEEQERLGGLEEEEGGTEAPVAGVGRVPMGGDRLVTPRTDEAVWAAAALGFLLVLLTLSVLHTRLYRHWRTTPSLYWRDHTQDYDSVTDIIRRRLKLAGRRKRRVAASRRHEAPLIPNSSTDEESD